jgi:uncharacterized delta-60 repeat protein
MKTTAFTMLRALYRSLSILMINLISLSSFAQDGANDPTFNKPDKIAGQGADNVVTVTALQPDGKLIIAGEFMHYNGANVTKIARLKTDGSIDDSFNARGGPFGKINAVAVLPDDKILVAGDFTAFDGVPANGMVRLNANGSVDKTFATGFGANKGLYKLLVQADGKIVIAGNFISGTPGLVKEILRINKDGSIDPSFHFYTAQDTLNSIQQMVLQPDGKILLAGDALIGSSSNYCAVLRLNSGGYRDNTFNGYLITYGDNRQYTPSLTLDMNGNILLASIVYSEGRVFNGRMIRLDAHGNYLGAVSLFWIRSVFVQNDGKILVVGFKYMDSDITWYSLKRTIVRLNKDFTIDSSYVFDDKKTYTNQYDADIATATLQSDGKIIIAGRFSETCGLITNNISRLTVNGNLDDSFNRHKGCNGRIWTSALQGDEKILIGGSFSKYNYQNLPNIARLKKNGEADPAFNVGTGTNGAIYTMAVQPNGKILIGGSFTSYNGHVCSNIARLNKNGDFDEGFTIIADNTIRKIDVEGSGKIIIAGDFKNVNGIARRALARIFANGQLDESFNLPLSSPDPRRIISACDFKITSRGQIYVIVNNRSRLNETRKTELMRLKRNGAIDSTFKTPEQIFYEIQTLDLNNDGKPIIGGLIQYYNRPSPQMGFAAQLNNDGSIDTAFHFKELTDVLTSGVRTITVLENDKVIIGGDFFKTSTSALDHIALLNKDGSVNDQFSEHADNPIYTAVRAVDDKLIIAGAFGEYSSTVRNGIARINVELPADSRFMVSPVISAERDEPGFSIYPNPASSFIHIENLKPGSAFRIFDVIGKEVFSGLSTDVINTVKISDYVNGMYFITAEVNGKMILNRFIVNR